MSRSDYERPAHYQIQQHFKCSKCGDEQNPPAGFSAVMPCPMCGGFVESQGESYPGNADDWDEVNVNGRWYNKNDIPGY